MTLSIADVALASIESAFPHGSCLFDARVLSHVKQQLGSLPAAASWAGFECRMNDAQPDLDFGLCIELARAAEFVRPEATSLCQRMLRNWLALEPVQRALIPRCTVEIDLHAYTDSTEDVWERAFGFFRVALAGGPELSANLDTILRALQAGPHVHGRAEQLARALPPGAQLLHLAALDHRGTHETRVHFAAHIDYLSQLTRAVDPTQLESVRQLRALVAGLPISRVAIQVSDLGGEPRPYSVELLLSHGQEAHAIWTELFRRLVVAGLASPSKARAVLRWPGNGPRVAIPTGTRLYVQRGFYIALKLGLQLEVKTYPYLCWSEA